MRIIPPSFDTGFIVGTGKFTLTMKAHAGHRLGLTGLHILRYLLDTISSIIVCKVTDSERTALATFAELNNLTSRDFPQEFF